MTSQSVMNAAKAAPLRVEKRDGRIVAWNVDNIVSAVTKAYKDVQGAVDGRDVADIHDLADRVEAEARGRYAGPVRIADLQTMVEQRLIATHHYEVAKAYTEYRFRRDVARAKTTDVNEAVRRFVGKDPSLVHENANKDSNVYATQRDLLAGAVSKAVAFTMLPPDVANAHMKGDIHFHDADYSPFTAQTNCSLPDFWDMLANGFTLGNAPMASPKSITVAATQITQIMKDVASSQYGGQSANRADEHLACYARLDYEKFLEEARETMPDDLPLEFVERQVMDAWKAQREKLHFEPDREDIPMDTPFTDDASPIERRREILAKIRTRKVIYDAMQTMEYQINSNRVSNGQTPFVTVGFGLGTDWFSREITRAIFLNRIRGLGSTHRTAIFPKLVYGIRDGVNSKPGDLNYDLKQLALECATKRMYPDIVFYENLVEITGDYKAPMGAVDGQEVVTWSDGHAVRTEAIERMWQRLSGIYEVKHQGTAGDDWYIDLPDVITIKDSHDGVNRFTPVRRMINNQPRTWCRVLFDGGRTIICTDDHPFETLDRGRVMARDLGFGDRINAALPVDASGGMPMYGVNRAWLMGLVLCDGCLNDGDEILVSFADHGEDEIGERIDSMFPADRLRHQVHHRGKRGDCKEIIIKDTWLRDQCIADFGGMRKSTRQVPGDILQAPRSERVAFLAGIIDADGYVNKSQRVAIGSTSKQLALTQMMLVESLGLYARVYEDRCKSVDNYEFVRYQVNFAATKEVIDAVACMRKRVFFDPMKQSANTPIKPMVRDVDVIQYHGRSYDVTTESDYFDVSGLVSHNCRSFLQKWVDPATGEEVNDGRMNLGVVSVNIPRIALESRDAVGHADMDRFWQLFDERMTVAHHALRFRIKRCKEASPKNAPTLFMYGAFGRLGPDGNVDDLFKDGRATVSLGYIGLAEATAVFYGKDWIRDHDWDPAGRDFALSVVKRMAELCALWQEEEGYHYSVYSTPAESLTDRFNRMDREKFGRVEGVTDHDFYTNSFHYPVWLHPTPMEKLDYEEPFPHYASGGFINYCEFPCMQMNPKALETVWDYAHDIGIGYLGTNTPIDHCLRCGFEGDFEPTDEGFRCPECSGTDPSLCDVTKRTCGYLGNPVQRPMAHGRHEEIVHRAKHMSGQTGRVVEPDGVEKGWFVDAAGQSHANR